MRTIGLIGGMSWESSLEYYRIINEETRKMLGGLNSAPCILYSFNFAEIEDRMHANDWESLADSLGSAAVAVRHAGADFVIICTNTMHKLAGVIEERGGLPVLHIADATGRRIAADGLSRIGLLGTRFTMEEDFYIRRLEERFGIEVLVPGEEKREIVDRIIFDELCQGLVSASSRELMVSLIDELVGRGAQGVILGCTEIPMLIRQEEVDIPVYDTTRIHAEAAVVYALGTAGTK